MTDHTANAGTLVEALGASARAERGELIFHLESGIDRLTTAELAERASARASQLVRLGVEPGDRLGLLGPNRAAWAEWAYAVWMAGGTLVPLQFPLRVRDTTAFAEQVASVVGAAGCRFVAADPSLLPAVPDALGLPWDEPPPRARARLPSVRPDDVAVLQFTSGSTAAPKGAEITHGAILAERRANIVGQSMDDSERLAGWLPYFHDGGLIIFLIYPTAFGMTGHVLPTERFARDPAELVRLIDRFDLTYTAGTPGAFWVAVRAAHRAKERVRLGTLCANALGAECVDPALMKKIFEIGGRLGMRPESPLAAYGLAEAVACVSSSPRECEMRIDSVDLDELALAGRAVPGGKRQKEIVSCGFPHPGVQLRILGPEGDAAERVVGEVLLRGPAMMRGYVGPHAEDPFVDGWLRTGDLGFVADGELFITGRSKDVVILSGQNYSAEDFEWAAARIDGVRGGRCAAFTRQDEEAVTIVVEPQPDIDPEDLALRVRNAITNVVGRVPTEVLVVGAGTLHRTTSGKLRRGAVKAAHEGGELVLLATARSLTATTGSEPL